MALSARKVQTAAPGRHSDGEGLSLLVQKSGSRSWVLRVQVDGKRQDVGLGPYPALSLSGARDKARGYRKAFKEGRDPRIDEKPKATLTFKEAAKQYIEFKRPGWKNAKHAAQWPSTLEDYVYPSIGDRDARSITTENVVNILNPIWTTKTETASRVRQRIEAVIDYAFTLEAIDQANPARWRNHLENLLAAPSKVRRVKHHAALDWQEAPEFWKSLRESESISAAATAFTILTATRSSEVREMRRREIDAASAVWTIPGERMKAGKEHRVPLTPEALALIGIEGSPDALVFESPMKRGRPLSDMSLTAVLKRMGRDDITVHGFRSTFRDWAGETTGHPREVIEHALAHQIKNKAEAAYARGDLFTKRRRLMEDWAAFVTSAVTKDGEGSNVVALPSQATG